jgi:hypothetical protein
MDKITDSSNNKTDRQTASQPVKESVRVIYNRGISNESQNTCTNRLEIMVTYIQTE